MSLVIALRFWRRIAAFIMVNEGCLSIEEFLPKISEYFKAANEKEVTVRVSTKRLVKGEPVEGNREFDATNNPHFDISRKAQQIHFKDVSQEVYPLLIRISYLSDAKKNKCSTVVKADDLDKFWQNFSAVIKGSMKGLIKKKKKKKGKAVVAKPKKGKKLKR